MCGCDRAHSPSRSAHQLSPPCAAARSRSRRVADDVVPLLLVKRFAFDLELLAVAKALGYDRIRELPVRLDYRFSGSGVGSLAVCLSSVAPSPVYNLSVRPEPDIALGFCVPDKLVQYPDA